MSVGGIGTHIGERRRTKRNGRISSCTVFGMLLMRISGISFTVTITTAYSLRTHMHYIHVKISMPKAKTPQIIGKMNSHEFL